MATEDIEAKIKFAFYDGLYCKANGWPYLCEYALEDESRVREAYDAGFYGKSFDLKKLEVRDDEAAR